MWVWVWVCVCVGGVQLCLDLQRASFGRSRQSRRPFTRHSQATRRPLAGHSRPLAATRRPLAGHPQATRGPFAGHSQAISRPLNADTSHSQAIRRPLAGHSQATHKPLTGHSRAIRRPFAGHSQASRRPPVLIQNTRFEGRIQEIGGRNRRGSRPACRQGRYFLRGCRSVESGCVRCREQSAACSNRIFGVGRGSDLVQCSASQSPSVWLFACTWPWVGG